MIIVDVLRTIALGELCFSIGFGAGLMCEMHKRARLPFWLWLMAVSYTLLASSTATEIMLRFGHAFTWRTPIAVSAGTIAFAATLYSYVFWRKRPYPQKRRTWDDTYE